MKSLVLAMVGCSLGVHNPRESCFFPNCGPLGVGGVKLHDQGSNLSGKSQSVSRVQPNLIPKLSFDMGVARGRGNGQLGEETGSFGVSSGEQWVMGVSTYGKVTRSGRDSGWRWVVSLDGGDVLPGG